MWGKAAAKGKGKGKGKDGGKKATPYEALPKARITEEPFTGVVKAWKGKFGFITPDEAIDHPKAALRQNDLYVSSEDLEGVESLTPGAPCQFHIYEDDSGLGAEEVIVTGEPDPSFTPEDNRPKGAKGAKGKTKAAAPKAAGGKGWAASAWSAPAKSTGKGWGASTWSAAPAAGKGWGKNAWSASGVVTNFAAGKGKEKGKGKDKGKGKSKDKATPNLPRERITAEKFTGEVESWKGKFGWIKPSEPIEHEKAGKRKGLLYVSVNDIESEPKELTPGATVEFHIYEDSDSLGAEEVISY